MLWENMAVLVSNCQLSTESLNCQQDKITQYISGFDTPNHVCTGQQNKQEWTLNITFLGLSSSTSYWQLFTFLILPFFSLLGPSIWSPTPRIIPLSSKALFSTLGPPCGKEFPSDELLELLVKIEFFFGLGHQEPFSSLTSSILENHPPQEPSA